MSNFGFFWKIFLNLLNLKFCTVHDYSLWDKNLLSYLEHTRQFKGSTKKAPFQQFVTFSISYYDHSYMLLKYDSEKT